MELAFYTICAIGFIIGIATFIGVSFAIIFDSWEMRKKEEKRNLHNIDVDYEEV